jgi:hypothetical protein
MQNIRICTRFMIWIRGKDMQEIDLINLMASFILSVSLPAYCLRASHKERHLVPLHQTKRFSRNG